MLSITLIYGFKF